MSSSEKRTEELLDRLVLEIKGLVLLHGSEADLKAKLRHRLVDIHDENLKKFVDAVQVERHRELRRLLGMALGELVLASLLVLAGAVVLLPTVTGINDPTALVRYFSETVTGSLASSPVGPYIPLIEFGLGAVLMVSAFYTLRQAALNLKEAGLAVVPGEG